MNTYTVGTYSPGKLSVVYDISIQVLPTAPSPTTTHLIGLPEDIMTFWKINSNGHKIDEVSTVAIKEIDIAIPLFTVILRIKINEDALREVMCSWLLFRHSRDWRIKKTRALETNRKNDFVWWNYKKLTMVLTVKMIYINYLLLWIHLQRILDIKIANSLRNL